MSFFSKNKNYILDGGSGQTLLEKGLVPKGTLWSATALIDENLHNLVLDMHKDFINAGSDLIVTSNFSVRKKDLMSIIFQIYLITQLKVQEYLQKNQRI